MNDICWSGELETMPAEEQRRYEAPLLSRQIEYLYKNSEYYRAQFGEAGIKPQSITCQEALEQLPFTEKKDLAQTERNIAWMPML